MRTDSPMTTDAALAAEHGWTQVQWQAAYEAACNSVEDEHLSPIDPDNTDAREQARKSIADAVTNAWAEGHTHDEWVAAALRRLR